MTNPFDGIKGQITVNGRIYSAKEVVRGLLEQGISITESTEGLKIGFKQFSPLSSSQEYTYGNDTSECPFIPYMTKITSYLEEIASRLDLKEFKPSYSSKSESNAFLHEKPDQSSFSPFDISSFQSERKKNQENEKFFSPGGTFLDNRQKCTACGTILPQNAFFCNKCGNHIRSG